MSSIISLDRMRTLYFLRVGKIYEVVTGNLGGQPGGSYQNQHRMKRPFPKRDGLAWGVRASSAPLSPPYG